MMLAIVAFGFLIGTLAGGLALINGSGLLLALLAYGAAGAVAVLIPVLIHAVIPEREDAAWDLDANEAASA